MKLPAYKVVSLFLRVFSTPLVNYLQAASLKEESTHTHTLLKNTFIRLGNWYNRTELELNRRFMKVNSRMADRPLSNELAVQKGVEFFFGIIFYLIVLGFPLYEIYRGQLQSNESSERSNQRMKKMENQIEQILKQLPKAEEERKKEEAVEAEKIQMQRKYFRIKLQYINDAVHVYQLKF